MNPPRLIPFDAVDDTNSDNEPAALSVRGLTVSYDDKPALWDVDIEVPGKSLMAVIGPNGAGKSTMIKAVLGLIPVLAGEIRIFDAPLKRARKRISYVPQRTSVDWDFPASAEDAVAMGLYGRIGWCRPVRRRHRDSARAFLDQVGMADFADRQIGQLSGGQQQRVFLARALAQDADLYLMDEPFAGVDAATEQTIVDVMRDARAGGATVVCVHHDLQTVGDYFDRAVILNVRAIAEGTIPDILTEGNLQAAYGGALASPEIRAIARTA
ncbi:MAG: ABC transporter ATP-binding protein [Pseudomonadota bacterium]|nr:ABC transporter ATP-binding protein [Pseudomonadota bacterium]